MLFLFFFVVWSSFSGVLCIVRCALCFICALVSNNFRAWTTDFTVLKFRDNNNWCSIIYTMNGFFLSSSLFSSLPIIWRMFCSPTCSPSKRDILGVATLFYIIILSLHEAHFIFFTILLNPNFWAKIFPDYAINYY